MRTWGTSVLICVAAATMASCSVPRAEAEAEAPAAPEAVASATAATPSSAAPTRSSCTTVSKAALAAVDRTVRAEGAGDSLPDARAARDLESGMWLIVGAFAGPAGRGEGAMGLWATEGDVTSDSFHSTIYAVDGGATAFSAAPEVEDRLTYNSDDEPAYGCWHSRDR